MNQNLFRKEAIEEDNKKSDTWGGVLLIQPVSNSILVYVIAFFILITIIFLINGSYSKKETVQGFLVPNKGVSKIYSEIAGVINENFIHEGAMVEKGEVMFTIDTGTYVNSGHSFITGLINSKNKMIELSENKIQQQNQSFELGQEQQQTNLDLLQKRIDIAENQLESMEARKLIITTKLSKMQSSKFSSSLEIENQKLDLLNETINIMSLKREMMKLTNLLIDQKADIVNKPILNKLAVTDLKQEIIDLETKILELNSRKELSIVSPSQGIVTALQVHEGQMVQSGKPLITIVPLNTNIQAHLLIPTRSSGLIKVGQPVRIRYSAFPYARFGVFEGTVIEITNSVILPSELIAPIKVEEPIYRAIVSLKNQSINVRDEKLILKPGMLLEADIVIEKISFIDWLLTPFKKFKKSRS